MKAQMYNYSSWIDETEPKYLLDKFTTLLNNAGFNVLDVLEYKFNPIGYTALFLLSESHFAIHTFPENNQTYIELSSCVKQQFDNFVKTM